ncbi:2-oxoglutarate-dependent dioxygenase 19-like [Corylus avellana]|uniref:2-oxoglutarate-dependent dioxygenase 19-like n=1 Tax=Corylus avellana TaxID=13451 RepID=UPI001E23579B|nr:2-oxoglutarate-dependent dioxygenase 19-like [Corylus avellana]
MISIKALAESPGLTSIPPKYTFTRSPNDEAVSDDPEESIPIIDFFLLTSGTPDQRSKTIHQLGKACQDWGFFMVINHGVPESLMKAMTDVCGEFFNLTEEEKREYGGKHVLDSIRCGTSINASVDKVLFWRDFVKFFVHPQFHSPSKPAAFREISLEYSKRSRELAMELLKGISMSLELGDTYIQNALNMESGLQILIANLYPPCPEPELAIGLPPHSDHGLLTLLIQNEISGLQVQHQSKWVNVNSTPNAFVVNIGDQMEIMSNGKYKSVVHRAFVNEKATRISMATIIGPPLDSVVGPAREFVHRENNAPAYTGMKYKEYMHLQQSHQIDAKSCLDHVRILPA